MSASYSGNDFRAYYHDDRVVIAPAEGERSWGLDRTAAVEVLEILHGWMSQCDCTQDPCPAVSEALRALNSTKYGAES